MRAKHEASGVGLKEEPIENPGSIDKIERYHAPLRAAYEKIRSDNDKQSTGSECLKMDVF